MNADGLLGRLMNGGGIFSPLRGPLIAENSTAAMPGIMGWQMGGLFFFVASFVASFVVSFVASFVGVAVRCKAVAGHINRRWRGGFRGGLLFSVPVATPTIVGQAFLPVWGK